MAAPAAAAPACDAAAHATQLSSVDDACLLNVFRQLAPLPDLFAAAAVCRVRRAAGSAPRCPRCQPACAAQP
jgi:hypothetical protein